MTSTAQWRGMLEEQPVDAWPEYLDTHSGLPGPRANTALVSAVAEIADRSMILHLCDHGSEFAVMCAAAALGRRSDDNSERLSAQRCAEDQRWRVREGVVIGLQLLGDDSPGALTDVVIAWAGDTNLLTQRAAVAAICEPRLLKHPDVAAVAVEVCRRTTQGLVHSAPGDRTSDGGRALRQTLGYAWSVAVAADPGPGLVAFRALDLDDPDIAWIVAKNTRKKRLARVL